MNIETKRLIIRNMLEEDISSFYHVCSNPLVMKHIDQCMTLEESKRFIKSYGLNKEPYVYSIILKETNAYIGHIIFHSFDEDSYEFGWVLGDAYWNKGYASELLSFFLEYAKGMSKNLVLECDKTNATTIHIAEKYGFIYSGVDNDLLIYKKALFN